MAFEEVGGGIWAVALEGSKSLRPPTLRKRQLLTALQNPAL